MPRMGRVYHNRRKTAWTDYVLEETEEPKTVLFDNTGAAASCKDSGERELSRQASTTASTAGSDDSGPEWGPECACPCSSHLLRVLKGGSAPGKVRVCEAAYSEYELSGRALGDVLKETDERGWAPMLIAAQRGYADAVRALIELGAKVDCQEPGSGWTPLMYAAAMGRRDIAESLLAAGAAVDYVARPHDWTALCAACVADSDDVVRVLLDAGADVRAFRRKYPDLAQRFGAAL